MKLFRDDRPPGRRRVTLALVASYALDWAILVAIAIVGLVLGNIKPNQRPFWLEDPSISFPYTERETVTAVTLIGVSVIAPIGIIAVVALVFVPGSTVPRGTPQSLVWRRKLWELHAGWLGLASSLVAAWFITNGMKNLFGKPRPDLLARCAPDVAHAARYFVGSAGRLVSAAICTETDTGKLNDGFRSFPSGHSSTAAAGLIYLSLFVASKFAITLPFLAPGGSATDARSFSAFPSRLRQQHRQEHQHRHHHHHNRDRGRDLDTASASSSSSSSALHHHLAVHNATVIAARRQAAAPPLHLLVAALFPALTAVFIASSRWSDFRHHGFDILFGFALGLLAAVVSFRYYHLPLRQGAGWAWGPRSPDKAFWSGIGSFSYATARFNVGDDDTVAVGGSEEGGVVNGGGLHDVHHARVGDEEQALPLEDGAGATGARHATAIPAGDGAGEGGSLGPKRE